MLLAGLGCDSGKSAPAAGNGKDAPSGGLKELVKRDVKVGDGPEVKKGDLVFLSYTGKLKNGMVFDSNDKPGANPFAIVVGEPGVIEAWMKGIEGMRVGGVRELDVPAKMGYGDQAAPGGKIPPGSDLYFTIKLHDAVKKSEENYFDKTDLKVGTGAVAEKGDTVKVDYVGKLVNGRVFDSTIDRKKPESFKLGAEQVISGLEAGIVGMRVGGKRRIRIPPNIGYGEYGFNMVPGNQIVIFEVDLLEVKKG